MRVDARALISSGYGLLVPLLHALMHTMFPSSTFINDTVFICIVNTSD